MEKIVQKLKSHHWSAVIPMTGTLPSLTGEELVDKLKQLVAQCELTAVAQATANFQPQGCSAVVVLQESHIAVHLWPEHGMATIDIHVCDYSGDNEAKAVRLAQLVGLQISGDKSLSKWSHLTVMA